MTKTRADMAAYIKSRKDCTMQDAELSALLAVEWLLNAVASGDRVELRGFGTFRVVDVPERKSNLPDGGIIPASISVKFRPAAALKRLCGRRKSMVKTALRGADLVEGLTANGSQAKQQA